MLALFANVDHHIGDFFSETNIMLWAPSGQFLGYALLDKVLPVA